MSLGTAAIYRYIPIYYAEDVGAVGGLFGLIGGLGGFVLPIAFGLMADLTGIWTSCFLLLFLIALASLVWMQLSIRQMEHRAAGEVLAKLPALAELEEVHRQKKPAVRHGLIEDWRPEDETFWKSIGRENRATQSVDFHTSSFACIRRMDGMERRGREATGNRFHLHDRSTVLVGSAARSIRRDPPHLLRLHGANRRWSLVDGIDHGITTDPCFRHRICGAESRHAVFHFSRPRAAMRLWRGQLRFLNGKYQLLLPQEGEGQRARAQCRSRQSRCERGSVRRTAGDHSKRLQHYRRRTADNFRWHENLAAECRLYLGPVSDHHDHCRLVWHG